MHTVPLRRARDLAVLLGALSSWLGCANSDRPDVAALVVGDVVVLRHDGERSSMDSTMTGTLRVVDGCLLVDEVVPAWPSGDDVQRLDDGEIEVRGRAIGEEIDLAGGLAIGTLPDPLLRIARQLCGSREVFIVGSGS